MPTTFASSQKRQRGFSLIELMLVSLILVSILAVVFGYISQVITAFGREESKLDIFQPGRAAMDQITRDLHQSGYPNATMYAPGTLATPPENDNRNAVGLFSISQTTIALEGDVDGDGFVNSVQYQVVTTPTNGGTASCPCLERSQVNKALGVAPGAQNTSFSIAAENVAPNGLQFSAFDTNGVAISLAAPIADLTAIKNVKSVQITLNLLGQKTATNNQAATASLSSLVQLNY